MSEVSIERADVLMKASSGSVLERIQARLLKKAAAMEAAKAAADSACVASFSERSDLYHKVNGVWVSGNGPASSEAQSEVFVDQVVPPSAPRPVSVNFRERLAEQAKIKTERKDLAKANAEARCEAEYEARKKEWKKLEPSTKWDVVKPVPSIKAARPAEAKKKSALQALIDAPKGNVEYMPGQAFMLHVFWVTPSLSHARDLLAGLKRCAVATHRDTPCTPLYFFRISNIDADLVGPVPHTVGEHPMLREALKKLQLGVPVDAVRGDLQRRGLDPDFASLALSDEVPSALAALKPVVVECTELYLDQRGFYEHAGSRDYLDAYGAVTKPSFMYKTPTTVRLGTPTKEIVEGVLPMLKELPLPLLDDSVLWKVPAKSDGHALFVSLDVPSDPISVPRAIADFCPISVAFSHPVRAGSTRMMAVFPSLPSVDLFASLAALSPSRGEIHFPSGAELELDELNELLKKSGLSDVVCVNATEAVGYVLHDRASALRPLS